MKAQWGTFASADIFEGARPRTQNLDIIAGFALTIEKSLDLKSNCAIAQQDVMQHYDTLQLTSIYRWLRAKGCNAAIAGASLRHQLLPALKVTVRGHVDYVYNRCIGALTGSRVAGQLGRVPIQETLHVSLPLLRELAWQHESIDLRLRDLEIICGL